MKRWACILNNKVINIILSDEVPTWNVTPDGIVMFVECLETMSIDDEYINGEFIKDFKLRTPINSILSPYKLLTIYLINDCSRRCSYCPCGEWNVITEQNIEDAKNNNYPDPNNPNMLSTHGKEPLLKWIKTHIDPLWWRIEITGGEPSMVSWCNDLLKELSDNGYQGIIRHNGDFPLIKTEGFLRVTAWHDTYPTLVKYPGDVFLILDEDDDKKKWCKENGYPYKLIFKDTPPTREKQEEGEEPTDEYIGWGGWAYIYSNGQLSAGNGCPESSYSLGNANIWNNSPPLIREYPCTNCNSIVGYEYVSPMNRCKFDFGERKWIHTDH